MKEKFINNNGVQIHYIVLNESLEIPLIFIPGALASADDLYNDLKDDIDLYFIIISKRGSGKSGTPKSGYSNNHFISDIDAVVTSEGLNNFYIMGHSVGAGLAAAYSVKYPEKIKGLIMADYPPAYPAFPQAWVDRVKNNLENVNVDLINGMVKESVRENYLDALSKCSFRKLILKADGEDSLLSNEVINKIKEKLPDAEIKIISNCGHEMFFEKPEESLKIIDQFIR